MMIRVGDKDYQARQRAQDIERAMQHWQAVQEIAESVQAALRVASRIDTVDVNDINQRGIELMVKLAED